MILTDRKKELEIGIYQKEVHEELQAAYEKDQFAKYANEEKFDTFICEGKKNNGGCVVVVEENHVKHWRDEKTNSGVVYKGMDAVRSFKKFAGKEINFQREDINDEQSILGMEKLKRLMVKEGKKNTCDDDNPWELPSGDDCGKNVFERIDQIRHAIAEVRHCIRRKIEMKNSKNVCSSGDDMTELFLSLTQLRENFGELTTLLGVFDSRFGKKGQLDGHRKGWGVTSGRKEKNGLGKRNNYILPDCKLDERVEETVHPEMYISLRQRNIYKMLEELQAKVEKYEWVLTEECSHQKDGGGDQGESVGHTLLCIAMFLNLCMNENMGKRILNYIYLQRIEIKKCKQYMLSLNKGRSVDIFCSHVESLTKGVPWNEDPTIFVDKLFRIDLTEENEQILTLYKRLLRSELGVDLMLREMETVNSTITRICQNLGGLTGEKMPLSSF
ncbi:conserved Plasmodium protein, unknown function [Plasmodium knowlesi strain H]|uniref:Uncharacterized protein n=3 Tax=Plasmodium knowlesi TaxID=5850 RepID=A0A5K1V5D1_PLAKH|nr:conserved Plasmodium protein, unknown function [Plasmodium knowlesi strain H]OTN65754.1 Uncharacterized protein PKNOH_S100049700 [Plasmodium knowlesi]CAA9987857.1 conserved Plasmodium protein, unknown function [Plasmodium knowlesi strain H]SBO22311.1 conserved Plasmodium protein, unknown function [Plasmodium knowlesi strain H]SBO28790.1 conserved Plasmodium protein, unknown function [Plasmodium knowlesi strain H]VVS77331.1 conserved Plasmodium protein, unknown function [Plasmodium knowlesi |eukprot:XP_002258855.1 hypothetical protein, conserved in Plasmodium species [Plasmodium knowlesi strain H]